MNKILLMYEYQSYTKVCIVRKFYVSRQYSKKENYKHAQYLHLLVGNKGVKYYDNTNIEHIYDHERMLSINDIFIQNLTFVFTRHNHSYSFPVLCYQIIFIIPNPFQMFSDKLF